MKTVLIVGAVALLAVALLLWGGGEPRWIRHRGLTHERLEELVGFFVLQGFDGATLTVQEGDDGRFFQLRMEKLADTVRLTSDYPLVPWSKPYYDEYRRWLRHRGLVVEERTGPSDFLEGNVERTMTISFGRNAAEVVQVIESLFRDIYRVDLKTDGELIMRGLNSIRQRPKAAGH